jgi:hypothetical protein
MPAIFWTAVAWTDVVSSTVSSISDSPRTPDSATAASPVRTPASSWVP